MRKEGQRIAVPPVCSVVRKVVGVYFGIKISRSPIVGISDQLPDEVDFLFRKTVFPPVCENLRSSRQTGQKGRIRNHRNFPSTSAASTVLVSHLCQSSSFGICEFSTGRNWRMYSPSFFPISSRIADARFFYA